MLLLLSRSIFANNINYYRHISNSKKYIYIYICHSCCHSVEFNLNFNLDMCTSKYESKSRCFLSRICALKLRKYIWWITSKTKQKMRQHDKFSYLQFIFCCSVGVHLAHLIMTRSLHKIQNYCNFYWNVFIKLENLLCIE